VGRSHFQFRKTQNFLSIVEFVRHLQRPQCKPVKPASIVRFKSYFQRLCITNVENAGKSQVGQE
jgi:hypothetical protein